MYWAIGIITAGLLAFLVWASADVGSGVYLRTLCRRKTDRPVVAVTFDDGPDPEMTPKVLAVLKKHGVKAAFFLIGAKAEAHPELVCRIVEEGHIAGGHTFTHSPLFPLRNRRSVVRELRDTQQAVEAASGLRPLLFRPPFGVTNPVIGKAVHQAGLQGIGWSIRSLDTLEGRDREAVCRRIRRRLHKGAVILLHDRCADADLLVEAVIGAVRASGMDFVALDELFEIECYGKN